MMQTWATKKICFHINWSMKSNSSLVSKVFRFILQSISIWGSDRAIEYKQRNYTRHKQPTSMFLTGNTSPNAFSLTHVYPWTIYVAHMHDPDFIGNKRGLYVQISRECCFYVNNKTLSFAVSLHCAILIGGLIVSTSKA